MTAWVDGQGVRSFAQAQDMLAPGGLLQLIGAYHGQPLPLDAAKIMGKRLRGGYPPDTDRAVMGRAAMRALAAGEVRVQPLITHRFDGQEAKRAFDFLYAHPEQALGVLFPVGMSGAVAAAGAARELARLRTDRGNDVGVRIVRRELRKWPAAIGGGAQVEAAMGRLLGKQ